MTEQAKKLKCFVISPFGEPNSDIRREADWVLKDLIRRALADDYDVVRADEFDAGNIITNRMIIAITQADLIVAVMSGHNPNAFYELAVAHAYSKPVIPLIEAGQKIPFDVGMVGTVVYSRADVDAWNAAKDALRRGAQATRVAGYKAENPITMALGVEKASASASSTDQLVVSLSTEIASLKAQMLTLRGRVRVLSGYDSLRTSDGQTWTWPKTDNGGHSAFSHSKALREAEWAKEWIPSQDMEPDAPPFNTSDDEPPKKP